MYPFHKAIYVLTQFQIIKVYFEYLLFQFQPKMLLDADNVNQKIYAVVNKSSAIQAK